MGGATKWGRWTTYEWIKNIEGKSAYPWHEGKYLSYLWWWVATKERCSIDFCRRLQSYRFRKFVEFWRILDSTILYRNSWNFKYLIHRVLWRMQKTLSTSTHLARKKQNLKLFKIVSKSDFSCIALQIILYSYSTLICMSTLNYICAVEFEINLEDSCHLLRISKSCLYKNGNF